MWFIFSIMGIFSAEESNYLLPLRNIDTTNHSPITHAIAYPIITIIEMLDTTGGTLALTRSDEPTNRDCRRFYNQSVETLDTI